MKSHVIAGCFVLLQPIVAFAAQPIIEPEDQPRAAAPSTDARPLRTIPRKSARIGEAKSAAKDPRHIIQPSDRSARPGSPRGLIDPSDQRRGITAPQDKPRGSVRPKDRLRAARDAAESRRRRESTATDSRGPLEGGSFDAADVAIGEAKPAASGRWRALAEELALRLVGNCIASLAGPADSDGQPAGPTSSVPAAQSGCPVLPLTSTER